ncbi:MAG: hypothetical protein GY811_06850 [Myxococcales bacterium]|nr:hypothetical protein [Myxococcales bacterium]
MNTSYGLLASSLALLLSSACTGGAGDDVVAEPSEVAAAISQGVAGNAIVAPTQVALAEGLFSLAGATEARRPTVERARPTSMK